MVMAAASLREEEVVEGEGGPGQASPWSTAKDPDA